jgi:hypothetical protein
MAQPKPKHDFPEACFHGANLDLPVDPFLIFMIEEIDKEAGALKQLPDRFGELTLDEYSWER